MRGVCAVEPEWLPQCLPNECSFGKPITTEGESTEPRFDAHRGVVVCHRAATFGKLMWHVDPAEVEWSPPDLELYKWFARFLLDGKVCDQLSKYVGVLLASPSTMLKSWAKWVFTLLFKPFKQLKS